LTSFGAQKPKEQFGSSAIANFCKNVLCVQRERVVEEYRRMKFKKKSF
jgi:hypothetical protein